jgi:ATP-binding cassette subfamily B protein
MTSLNQLPKLLRPYWPHLLASMVLLLIITGATLAVPELIQRVIDEGLATAQIKVLGQYGMVILGIGVIRAAATFLQRYLSEFIANRVAYDLRNRLYDHIQHQSFTFHDHAQTGQLISRGIEDVRSIRQFTGFGLVELVQTILLFVGIILLLFLEQPRLAAIALLPMLPLLTITTRFGGRISQLFLAVDQAMGELAARLQENVLGAPVVRAFAREPHEINRFDTANQELFDARVNVISAWSNIMPTTRLLVSISTLLIIWFGGRLVLDGQMTIGEVVAFNSFLLMLGQPAQQLAWLVNLAGEAAAGLKRIFQVLDQESEIVSPAAPVFLPPLSGSVLFDQVSVKYAGEATYALQDIDLTVEPNQIIALIGATGSGKSTLVNLIPRFYDVSAGQVCVDGIDVREVELASLRRQIGIVPQTSLLFSLPIRENIAYGRPDATRAEITAAALAAQAHEFILAQPEGYDTVVGERGITLSGGQRQRIAIARALLMDPRILILDDSTSSVDIETEQKIQQALDNLMTGRTTFIIAQRLASVRRADVILVLDQGKVVEQGTHQALLQKNGLYREIYDLQLKPQEEASKSIFTSGHGK